MRTLIYKRTHSGDPDPRTGVFGNNDCMGEIRAWPFDAVIGIGGVGDEPKRHGIAGKLTWIGIGPQKSFDNPNSRGPQVMFCRFKYFGEGGPLLVIKYPALARHMYETHRRLMIHLPPFEPGLDRDVEAILRLARNAPPSGDSTELKPRKVRNKCPAQLARRPVC
jgi:hypothetical protein